MLDLSALHSASLAAGFGDSWSGTTWAYSHGYIQFAIEGEDTLVNYDQDGWYDSHSTTTIARLEGVNLASLSAVNAEPDPSDALYQIESASALSEDSNALVTYRVVLGKAPTADVVVSITGGDQIYVNDSSSAAALTFTADNWYIPQVVRLTAIDDLLIERDHDASLTHSFSSSDTEFDGLTAIKSVSITDNDFQRSIDQTKLPTAGNNKIIYDLDLSANNDWYTESLRNDDNGNYRDRRLRSEIYEYRLGVGADDIEVSSGVQTSIDSKNIVFFGEDGDDRIAFVNLADGGIGNDELIASTVARDGPEVITAYRNYSYWQDEQRNRGVIGENRSTNVLFGGDGDDVITGSVFADLLIGGLDSDTLTGDAGDDRLYGDGWSTIDWDNYANSGENHYGYRLNSDGNRAMGGADTITAGDGNDYVDGGAADDSIDAGEGDNNVYGGLGADTIVAGAGADNIYGGDGTSDPGVDGADEIHAGGGSDTVFGEGGDDIIYAEVGDDTVQGGDGDDSIYGAEGADTLYGNAGDDTISGGIDDDTIRGGIGADVLSGDSGSDTLYGEDQDDSLDGGDGDDALYGGSGADTLIGGLGADTIDGGADTDTISGGGGNDIITAGSGDDVIDGGDGDDTITAGIGADTITGGAGADTFVFDYDDFLDDQVDVIKDFTVGSGGDVLDLSALHSASLAANGVNSGQHNYPYSLGFIRFIQSGDDTVVAYDTDGPDLANEARSFAILKDVSPLNLTEDNLSVAGTNFGIARTGIISAVTETASEVQVTLRLWGGQPSADVDVALTLVNTDETSQTISFAPSEWMNTKTVTFTKSSGFNAANLQNLTAVLSSSDLNFDAETMRFMAEQGGDGSTFIVGQSENAANTGYYAFERTDTMSIDQLITSAVPQDVQVTTATAPYFSVVDTSDGLAIRASSDAPIGQHKVEISFIDANNAIATRSVTVEIFEENQSPTISLTSDQVVTTANPFTGVVLADDSTISELKIHLTGGFSSSVASALSASYTGSLAFAWDPAALEITLTGVGSATDYQTALDYVEVVDTVSTEANRTFDISVTDTADSDLFINTTAESLNYYSGITLTPSVSTWNGTPISGVNLFGFGHGQTDKLMHLTDVDFGENIVTFNVSASQTSIGVFDFSIDLGSDFSVSSSAFSESLIAANYLTLTNTDSANNVIYFEALSGSETITAGDSLVSVTLAYSGDGDIRTALGDISFNRISLGNQYQDNIGLIGNRSVSDSAGDFGSVSFVEGDSVFVIEKDTSDIGHAITSYDAYLAQKIAVLLDGSDTVDGISFTKEQIIAADVNQNGYVNSMDVYAILQEAINIDNSVSPEWLFVDSEADLAAVNRNNSQYSNYINEVVSVSSDLSFVGILTGDVNGSWTGV